MELDLENHRCKPTPLRSVENARFSGAFLAFCLLMLSCQPTPESPEGKLPGVWSRVESATLEAGEETVNSDPRPNLYIFTEGHYSIGSLRTGEPPSGFATPWQPSDEEKCARYDAFTFNSGTYEVVDGALVTHPLAARAADFVGGAARYQYRISGDTLWLIMVDEISPDGVPAPWVGTRTFASKLIRIE